MSTAKTGKELAKFSKQDAAITEMVTRFSALKVDGLKDKVGLKAVHDARMQLKAARVQIEKTRVELNEDALKFQRTVNAEAKRLTGMITPTEQHLQAEEDRVEEEKAKLVRAAEEELQKALQVRLDALAETGMVPNPIKVAAMSEEEFKEALVEAQSAAIQRRQEEEKRKAEEAEQRKRDDAERARLAEEKARLDKIDREQKAEASRLQAEAKKIEDEKLAQARALQLEEAKRKAAAKATQDAEEKAKRDAEAAEQRKREEAERLRREEAERPYRERLEAVAKAVESIEVPDGAKSKAVRMELTLTAAKIREIAKVRSKA